MKVFVTAFVSLNDVALNAPKNVPADVNELRVNIGVTPLSADKDIAVPVVTTLEIPVMMTLVQDTAEPAVMPLATEIAPPKDEFCATDKAPVVDVMLPVTVRVPPTVSLPLTPKVVA